MTLGLDDGDLLRALDLAGTFVFALSGGVLGVRRRFDLFGVLVLSFVAATSGGILRDLLIGAIPPAAIADGMALLVALAAGLLAFLAFPWLERLQKPVRLFDAMGLALFAVAGTQKALLHGLDPAVAAVLGMVTGIGGGMVRDLLAGQVPAVLHSDLYAVAGLLGAAIVAYAPLLHLPAEAAALIGAGACVFLRVMAIYRGWHLPVARFGYPPGEDGRGNG